MPYGNLHYNHGNITMNYRALIALFMLFTPSILTQAQNNILLATHEQEPLTYSSPKGEPLGIAMEPVLKTLRAMNWQAAIEFMPWLRAQELTRSGRVDGFFAASQNEAREGYAVRSEIIAWQRINWYLPRESPLDPEGELFKRTARVCSYLGANMQRWLETEKYLTAEPPADPDQLFLMVLAGRIDGCLANSYNFDNFIARHPELQERFKVVPQSSNALYVYFSRRFIALNPGFLQEFNEGVAQYRQEP